MATKSGVCGADAVYLLDTDQETITISGNGSTFDYNDRDFFPDWYEDRDYIRYVIISNNISRVGAYIFRSLNRLEKVTFADSVTEIGPVSFDHCPNLRKLELSKNLETIGNNAFDFCDIDQFWNDSIIYNPYIDPSKTGKYYPLEFPATLKSVGIEAFRFNSDMKKVFMPDNIEHIGNAAFAGMQYDFTLVGTSEIVKFYCRTNSCWYSVDGKDDEKA